MVKSKMTVTVMSGILLKGGNSLHLKKIKCAWNICRIRIFIGDTCNDIQVDGKEALLQGS